MNDVIHWFLQPAQINNFWWWLVLLGFFSRPSGCNCKRGHK